MCNSDISLRTKIFNDLDISLCSPAANQHSRPLPVGCYIKIPTLSQENPLASRNILEIQYKERRLILQNRTALAAENDVNKPKFRSHESRLKEAPPLAMLLETRSANSMSSSTNLVTLYSAT